VRRDVSPDKSENNQTNTPRAAPSSPVLPRYERIAFEKDLINEAGGARLDCCEYALRNGWSVDRVFREEGETAKNMNRPALIEITEYLSPQATGIASNWTGGHDVVGFVPSR